MQKALQDVTVLVQDALDEQSQARWDALVRSVCAHWENHHISYVDSAICDMWQFVRTLTMSLDTREQARRKLNDILTDLYQ